MTIPKRSPKTHPRICTGFGDVIDNRSYQFSAEQAVIIHEACAELARIKYDQMRRMQVKQHRAHEAEHVNELSEILTAIDGRLRVKIVA